ncbi:dermonecrotic toxin domain-containing protein [Pseudomonas alvandae]|uniref:Dermonecrotic toxin N-terminal domain-containing protein n=1 Tax=Pseudomonas canavaninivorans TaxID=2842348 RepID=A0ABX8QE32_PSECO|nr:DUF6543 domain-containing protein [Pseudomonas alvandae]QXI53483.1 hypothetical protein KSS97_00570 [Pseudomonas alvandae]
MPTLPKDGSTVSPQPQLPPLSPLNGLPDGNPFKPHDFADPWLLALGLQGDAQVRVFYQEIKAAGRAVEDSAAWVPLRAAVTQGFLEAYQSKPIPSPTTFARCESWVIYPYRNRMSLDFSLLRVDGLRLSHSVLTKLQTGVPPQYSGQNQVVDTEVGSRESPGSLREEVQRKQLKRLYAHRADLARLFAGLPTFDSVLSHVVVGLMLETIDPGKFRGPVLQDVDPGHWYVNRFSTDSRGHRSLVSSSTFSEVLWESLLNHEPPDFAVENVGFFTRPDTVQEIDSVFVDPIDESIVQAMASAFDIANPTTHDRVARQFLDDFVGFRFKEIQGALDRPDVFTTEEELALRLSQRFSYLFDLYKADRDPSVRLSDAARILQHAEDRLLEIIITHPSKAGRERLMNKQGVPRVYKVMLDIKDQAAQKWPAAMVIKRTDTEAMFLYSLEGGIQKFDDFQELVDTVNPFHEGQERKIAHIDFELIAPVFEDAAKELLQLQYTALESVLKAPEKARFDLKVFAAATEAALQLPMLELDGPLLARINTLFRNSRPEAYTVASVAQKRTYRHLEREASKADEKAAGKRVQSLMEFAREKINAYLRTLLHVDIDPDPDRTFITLFQGAACNVKDSRVASLTQLMLDNIRPSVYPNAMREIFPVQLADEEGRPLFHPVTGRLIVLSGPELAQMATSLDIGENYDAYLKGKLRAPDYQEAWWSAYKANMSFKGYEATLNGDQVFTSMVIVQGSKSAKLEKVIPLWLNAVLSSSTAQERKQVQGRKVHVHGLLLGGTTAMGNHPGRMSNSTSIDGVLIFSDQEGADIHGPVGVYFPDSPGEHDFYEFPDLGDGIAQLLKLETWQDYFSSRIATNNPDELRRTLGLQGGRPLIRGSLIDGNLPEALYAAHIRFLNAYANHRSNSNREIRYQTIVTLSMAALEAVIDIASTFAFFLGFLRLFLLVSKTGRIPLHWGIVRYLTAVGVARRPVGGMVGLSRNRSFLQDVLSRLRSPEKTGGLLLERAIYSRFSANDGSVIRGVVPDAGGFYRPTVQDVSTGIVTARPVYVRQPDGTVLRVHDNTKLNATEATLVDPETGLSIRSSGVVRSTIARMPDGEWRAVGFGLGGGGVKRSRSPSPQPGPSQAGSSSLSFLNPDALPRSLEDMVALVERSGEWNNVMMDMVPELMPNLPSWPRNRGLVIIDERPGGQAATMRFASGTAPIYQVASPPDLASDVVVRRRGGNHYELLQANRAEPIQVPRDGDCFFNVVAQGLNALEGGNDFSVRGLRVASARYLRQNRQLLSFLEAPQPLVQLESALEGMLGDGRPVIQNTAPMPVESLLRGILGWESLDFLRGVMSEVPWPEELFHPLRLYLGQSGLSLPPTATQYVLLKDIAAMIPSRPRSGLAPLHIPYTPGQIKSIQYFLYNILKVKGSSETLRTILKDPFFELNSDLMHMLFEYGVDIDDLRKFYPRNPEGYIFYDETVHGDISVSDFKTSNGGAEPVYLYNLQAVANRWREDTGVIVSDIPRLMRVYRYEEQVRRTVGLLRATFRKRLLLEFVETLLTSSVISSHLGGRLPVPVFARWVSHPSLNKRKLRAIAKYSMTRVTELFASGTIDIKWIHQFDQTNAAKVVNNLDMLVSFYQFLVPSSTETGMPAAVSLFSAAGAPPVNSRVKLLLDVPDLFDRLRNNFTPEQAQSVWRELISPNYSGGNINNTLAQEGSLNSEAEFTSALINSLMLDARRADGMATSILADHSISERLRNSLYQFDLSNNRAEYNWLSFVTYVRRHGQIPSWAWLYKKTDG